MAYNTFYIIRDSEGTYVKAYDRIDMDKFFYEVSKCIAFSDCSDANVLAIFWKGHEIYYSGWKLKNRHEYRDLDAGGETIWVRDFPEWDH